MDNKHDILSLLRGVAAGDVSPETALLKLKEAPFEDLGYAKVDFHRSVRQGSAEVIYGAGKTPEQIAGISRKMAAMLRFTERQATAILEMRLYRLIGLEIEALVKEHEETLKNIARYEDILNNYDSMAEVIIQDLDKIKEEFGRKRRTVIENGEEAVYEEKKIEEQDVIFLMDRFGYARTIDVSTYERNKDAADSENRIIIS